MAERSPREGMLAIFDRVFDRARGMRRDVSDNMVIAVVRELEVLGEPRAIKYLSHLIPGAPTAPSPLTDELARVMATLALAVDPSALPRLDRDLRSAAWSAVPIAIEALISISDPSRAIGLLCVASTTMDGHVRERALRRLAAEREPRALPFLFVRLDDWVDPVQRVALGAIESRTVPEWAPHFVRCLGMLPSLESRERAHKTKLVERLRRWLLRPELAGAIKAGLASPDRAVRLECFRLCAAAPHIDRRAIVEAGLRDSYPPVRWTASHLGSTLEGVDRDWFIAEACGHRDRGVRAWALDLLARRDGPAAEERLLLSAFDPAESVRVVARFHLGKIRPRDFAAMYAGALDASDPKRLAAALGGLEAIGSPAHVPLVVPLLEHREGRVAAAALLALARLDRSSIRARLPALLMADRPALARAAAELIQRRVSPADLPALVGALQTAPGRASRVRAVHLIGRCTHWGAVPPLLDALSSEDAWIREAARAVVDLWLRVNKRSLYLPPAPTAAERAACETALVRPAIDLRVRKAVEAALATCSSASAH